MPPTRVVASISARKILAPRQILLEVFNKFDQYFIVAGSARMQPMQSDDAIEDARSSAIPIF